MLWYACSMVNKGNDADAPSNSNDSHQDDASWLNEPPTVLQIMLALGGFVMVMVLAAAIAMIVSFLTRAGGLTQ